MIHCEDLVKIYKIADIEVFALQGLDLEVKEGEMMAIIGNSGSGKSTLLNMIGGLDRPSAGKLIVDEVDLLKANDAELVKYKREKVGFVWQNNARNLIPYLTAVENVEIPMLLKGGKKRQRALELLDMVGLLKRKNSRLSQLSGGEQQRVAIAIALSNNPKILLADEPTGNVDTKLADTIIDLFRELSRSMGITIVIVTHDLHLTKKVERTVAIRDGKTSSEFVMRRTLDEINTIEMDSTPKDEHIELTVLDRAGRLQIPKDYLEEFGMHKNNKVRVEKEDGKIVIYPVDMK